MNIFYFSNHRTLIKYGLRNIIDDYSILLPQLLSQKNTSAYKLLSKLICFTKKNYSSNINGI